MLHGPDFILGSNENETLIAAVVGQLCSDPLLSDEVFAEVTKAVQKALLLTQDVPMRYDGTIFTLLCWPERDDGVKVVQVYKNVGMLWTSTEHDDVLFGVVGLENT